jgi:hypothetical protein
VIKHGIVAFPLTAMLPLLATVIRPPLIPAVGGHLLLEQTQALIRLLCQQKQQQYLEHQKHHFLQLQHYQLHQQRQQQQLPKPVFKRILEDSPPSPESKRSRPETLNPDWREPRKPCSDWTVDDVCGFIASVELCKPYVEVREGVAAIF